MYRIFVFTYDPVKKRQSMYWKSPTSQTQEIENEHIRIQSNDDFFDIHGIGYLYWVGIKTTRWLFPLSVRSYLPKYSSKV